MSIKLQSDFKEQGLELPDVAGNGSGVRFKPDRDGVVTLPDSLERHALIAAKNAPFRVAGRTWGGFGEGSLPKPYRVEAPSAGPSQSA